ncbi:Uncharacterised protein [Mycobacteroides abscessus subsp. abscessus]|nr:Uncharacterised protein [Mycobacteroides abscessus subsp. abscessus]
MLYYFPVFNPINIEANKWGLLNSFEPSVKCYEMIRGIRNDPGVGVLKALTEVFDESSQTCGIVSNQR